MNLGTVLYQLSSSSSYFAAKYNLILDLSVSLFIREYLFLL